MQTFVWTFVYSSTKTGKVAEAYLVDALHAGPLPQVPLDDAGGLRLLDAVVMLDQALAVLGARAVRPRRHLGRPLAGPRLEAAGLLAVVLTEGPHAQGLVGHTAHHAGSIVCRYNVDNVPTAVSILRTTAGAVSHVTTAAAENQLKSSGRLSAVVVAGSCAALRRARCRDHSARGGGFHTTAPPLYTAILYLTQKHRSPL